MLTDRVQRSPRPILFVALAVMLLGCGGRDGGSNEGSGGRPQVVATTGIWADVVSNVACQAGDRSELGPAGGIDVQTLIPEGGDPHGFELSLADRALLDEADLVVTNGLGLEVSLIDALNSIESAGVPILALGDLIDARSYRIEDDHDHADDEGGGDADHDHDHDDGGHTHGPGGLDPHFWFDPQRVASVLDELGAALVDHAGLDQESVGACIDAYRAELLTLDETIVAAVEEIPTDHRLLVTSHQSLGYFADRYGFEVVATVSPSPAGLAEANPAHLEELADLMEGRDIRVVLAETQASADDAEALARLVDEAEVVTITVESLGPRGSGSDTYVGFVAKTADVIVEAIGR